MIRDILLINMVVVVVMNVAMVENRMVDSNSIREGGMIKVVIDKVINSIQSMISMIRGTIMIVKTVVNMRDKKYNNLAMMKTTELPLLALNQLSKTLKN